MIDLSKLAEPFPAEDIEWRVARAGTSARGIWCKVLAYITARAISSRLDEVCGPENWALTQPIQLTHETRCAIGVGISIRVGDEWITRWDVSELTDSNDNIPPFKGGFSGAMKRAGAQFGIGRYLYHLDEMYASEVSESEQRGPGWHWAQLPKNKGGAEFYWKEPVLPGWAQPKESETKISDSELTALKKEWKEKFAPDSKNRADLADGFKRFVVSVVGEFPMADASTWTRDSLNRCRERINATTEPNGVSSDVPFE